MAQLPLIDISEIHTPSFWYNNISNVEEVYLSGKHFLKFTHLNRSTQKREVVCVASETISKFNYSTSKQSFKTQAEVLNAYKDGRLVGY